MALFSMVDFSHPANVGPMLQLLDKRVAAFRQGGQFGDQVEGQEGNSKVFQESRMPNFVRRSSNREPGGEQREDALGFADTTEKETNGTRRDFKIHGSQSSTSVGRNGKQKGGGTPAGRKKSAGNVAQVHVQLTSVLGCQGRDVGLKNIDGVTDKKKGLSCLLG